MDSKTRHQALQRGLYSRLETGALLTCYRSSPNSTLLLHYSMDGKVLVLGGGNAMLMQVSSKFQVPHAGVGVSAIRKERS
ncbi:hypothetical protein L195_g018664 [Trifolium pratense]|uniref:Uncharacterized protein n=1 Tax=Trifolium pratense TaxID=57577 RepID=A0A2K3MXG6_TRIPR|nr:hypothetical protein L195_g018664 [Trifolium pratense]